MAKIYLLASVVWLSFHLQNLYAETTVKDMNCKRETYFGHSDQSFKRTLQFTLKKSQDALCSRKDGRSCAHNQVMEGQAVYKNIFSEKKKYELVMTQESDIFPGMLHALFEEGMSDKKAINDELHVYLDPKYPEKGFFRFVEGKTKSAFRPLAGLICKN